MLAIHSPRPVLVLSLCWFVATLGHAQQPPVTAPQIVTPQTAPPLPDGSDAAKKAIARFRFPDGLKVELFAAEPQLGNPVAICLDEKNRVYVAEQYRFNRGTEENRTRPFLLDDDLQIRTTAERLAMFQKFADRFEGGLSWFSKYTDQVRRLEDRDHDGRAEISTLFATGFNDPLDGMASGVIARDGDLFLTNIPKLWRLRDTNDDGVADQRDALLDGFGVNAAFLGHDLHGLAWGPDGKLYFSIGDRGYHVQTKEGSLLAEPRRGAVFRCDADGANLEVIHRGLRNPQELAFDEFGNLFADDNNCDKGDHSRLVFVLDGGDSGWNMAYQTIASPYLTGPWHAEKMWHLANADQPAWLLPPVGKLGAGPSGFCYYPGLGLPDRYRGHFFMCNYTGNGGVESFAVQPRGASFEITDAHDFLKPLQATDVDFGYDGQMYVSDYVGLEWNGGSKGGRIYTLHHPQLRASDVVAQTTALFYRGFAHRGNAELLELLKHPDMRVRQRAQFALAGRGDRATADLVAFANTAATNLDDPRPCLHAIWAMGQIARKRSDVARHLMPFLRATSPLLRAQTAKLLGDLRFSAAAPELLALLKDELKSHPPELVGAEQATTEKGKQIPDWTFHVQLHAAMSLGKLKHRAAADTLWEMLALNKSGEPYLRHAAVYALSELGDLNAAAARASDVSAEIRLGALLILRRASDPRVATFLQDAAPKIVLEAARAINDLHLDNLTAALAAIADRLDDERKLPLAEPLVRRVINAHFRLGTEANARAIVQLAIHPQATDTLRREAIEALVAWSAPGNRDRVTGYWRPLPDRNDQPLAAALRDHEATLVEKIPAAVRADLLRLLTKSNSHAADETAAAWLADTKQDEATRVAALQLLAQRRFARVDELLEQSLRDQSPKLRTAARTALASLTPDFAVKLIAEVLSSDQGVTAEKQEALRTLQKTKTVAAEKLLDQWLTRFVVGKAPAELQLELLEILRAKPTSESKSLLARYEASAAKLAGLSRLDMTLIGGDAEKGKELFVNHRAAQCTRCHKVAGKGGDAGPDLSKVASRGDRQFMLQSLIEPNAKIAQGFGAMTLVLDDGRVIGGILKSETPQHVVLLATSGQEVTIAVSSIEERTPMTSPMPPVTNILTPRELRDLVEYLSTLK